MIGITTGVGYPVPFEFRYPLLKQAGFDSVILAWGNNEVGTRVDRVWLAKAFDIKIEHAHATTEDLNTLWLPGTDGNRTCNRLLHELDDCGEFGIKTLVLHTSNGNTPPPVSTDGINRFAHLVRLAENTSVKLAFENVRSAPHLQAVLDYFNSPNVGLCYDAGHANIWAKETDWLSMYGDRLFAVHLHDNNGTADTHLQPFSGTVNWNKVAAGIAASSYTGNITVEVSFPGDALHQPDALTAHLKTAAENAKKLESMISSEKR